MMKKTLITFLFLFGFFSWPASANYAINNQCFATANEALDSFTSQYPKLSVFNNANNIVYTWFSVSSASISGQNLTVVMRNNTTNLASIVIPIQNCTNPSSPAYDYATGSMLWGFAFTFVLGLWYVSKNIGLILQAVRRF